ncbi:MAG TPA: TonB family protein [Verrucomicrobiae bacterium]|nr:TonB family protein [Verrucomicrobiae bacterium]
MAYQALLFCPEEKIARTVTQVLSELEFSVEACAEPFAAVKKLMGEHFDAVVVDCDNEQNATLLFKSARNSVSNQSSLAVAVVEGQAGVAKAFRIGANLVLTKPINVDQAKGTLRVARGLLRKGESGKPAATLSAPAATRPAAPGAPKAAPVPAAPRAIPRPEGTPVGSQFGVASQAPARKVSAPPVPAARAPEPSAPISPVPAPAAEIKATPSPSLAAPGFSAPSFPAPTGSAASAPAPARTVDVPPAALPATVEEDDNILESATTAEPAAAVAASSPAPSFTFGGANAPEESSGGSKKILLGLVAVVLVGVVGYVAWSYLGSRSHGTSSVNIAPSATTGTQPAPASSAPASAAGVKPEPAVPVPNAVQPAPETSKPETSAVNNEESEHSSEESSSSAKSAEHATKTSTPAKPSEMPLVVKGGAVPSLKAKPQSPADAPAPSVMGIAAPASGEPLPALTAVSTPKPVLEKLNISQGVSQGLLLKKVEPIYPTSAVQMRIEGSVRLLATISKTGTITKVKVLSGPTQLARAASDAVKQWKYAPYLLNGEPVEIETQVTIDFKLPN